VNVKSRECARGTSGGAGVRGRAAGLGVAAMVMLANASVVFGQSIEEAPAGDPIEETWRYLVELFRMVLGL